MSQIEISFRENLCGWATRVRDADIDSTGTFECEIYERLNVRVIRNVARNAGDVGTGLFVNFLRRC